jgi:hypothetical protein
VCGLDLHQRHFVHWLARVIGCCPPSHVVELAPLRDLRISTQEFVSYILWISLVTTDESCRHALSLTTSPSAGTKKLNRLRLILRLLNGDLQKVESMARNGLLLNTWDILRRAAILVVRIQGTATRRSKLGVWRRCDRKGEESEKCWKMMHAIA